MNFFEIKKEQDYKNLILKTFKLFFGEINSFIVEIVRFFSLIFFFGSIKPGFSCNEILII